MITEQNFRDWRLPHPDIFVFVRPLAKGNGLSIYSKKQLISKCGCILLRDVTLFISPTKHEEWKLNPFKRPAPYLHKSISGIVVQSWVKEDHVDVDDALVKKFVPVFYCPDIMDSFYTPTDAGEDKPISRARYALVSDEDILAVDPR